MIDNYKDIINMSHHVSKTRAPMPIKDRAAQFAAFAALDGHNDAIDETARLTNSKRTLHEDKLTLLDEKLSILFNMDNSIPITIEYFIEDEAKVGGRYISVSGKISKIDDVNGYIIMQSGLKIPINDIYDINSDIF